jgi:hypothetical protein
MYVKIASAERWGEAAAVLKGRFTALRYQTDGSVAES